MTEKEKLAQKFTQAVQEGMVAFVPAFLAALQKQGIVLGVKPEKDTALVDVSGKPV